MNGWIKLYRQFSEWEWSDDPKMVSLFIHLLLAASNRDTRWKGIEIKRGQVLFGRQKWSAKTGISEQSLRTCLNRLKSTSEITIKSTSKYSIVTIVNYDKYQGKIAVDQPANQPPDQPSTNHQLTSDQPHREKERRKEGKKKRNNNTGGDAFPEDEDDDLIF